MLYMFRKHATSWLIKVALFAIVIVFVFWGGYSYQSRKASRVARVDDHFITINQYKQAYDQLIENYRKRFGDQFSEDMIRQLNVKQQALDMLIDRYLVMIAAGQMGIEAGTAEIQQQIVKYPAFQNNGQFDQQRYLLVLRQNHLSPEQFEQQLYQDLTISKVEQFVKSQAIVTKEELQANLLFDHSEIQIGFVRFLPSAFRAAVTVTADEVKTFYESNQDRYMEPAKRRFAWVDFKADDYLSEVSVDPSEVATYYEDHRDEFHQDKEVHARHILFRLTENAPEQEVAKVRSKAEKIMAEAKKEGADFAELAKQHSQGPTAGKGGDLGYFSRERMVPAFSEVAFSLKTGEVSDLVRTRFGFHIIKVEDIREESTQSLEQAKSEIEQKLKTEKARDIAYQKAREFSDVALADGDVAKAAAAEKIKLEAPDTWFAEREALPGIGSNPELMGQLFGLTEGEVSQVLEWSNGYLVAQMKADKAAEPSLFEKVKDRVENDLRAERAKQASEQAAKELLAAAKAAKSLQLEAAAGKLAYQESDWFSRKKPSSSLPLWGESQDEVFALNGDQPFPEKPLNLGNQIVVCQLLEARGPSPEQLDKAKPELEKQLLATKQQQLWQAWVKQRQNKSEVEILQEM